VTDRVVGLASGAVGEKLNRGKKRGLVFVILTASQGFVAVFDESENGGRVSFDETSRVAAAGW
jgi:hypothetical protein